MSFTLKDIKGAVVKEKCSDCGGCQLPCDDCINMIINDGTDMQSSVKLRFNREKLARVIAKKMFDTTHFKGGNLVTWESTSEAMRQAFLNDADAIIAADKDIIEVEKE